MNIFLRIMTILEGTSLLLMILFIFCALVIGGDRHDK